VKILRMVGLVMFGFFGAKRNSKGRSREISKLDEYFFLSKLTH